MSMLQCVVITKSIIDEALAQSQSPGKHLLEPLKTLAAQSGLPFNILEDCEVTKNDAEVHEEEGDLWLCLQGEARFVVDGALVEPKTNLQSDGTPKKGEFYAEKIDGGKEVVLTEGDWLWVPPGQPHQHTCPDTARLMIIKIPAKCV